jgi:hypothetical protein
MRKLFYLTLIFLGVASACKKERQRDFPFVNIDEYVYLSNPSSFEIQTVGGAIYQQGGYQGLIIYRRFGNGNVDDFAAYDRACPTHYREDCGVLDIDDDRTFAVCRCGGEKYLLFDGSPAEDASTSMVEYRAVFNGSFIRVTN